MDESEFSTFSIRMPEALKARIELIAKQNYNSRNGMICLAVERMLDGIEADKARSEAAPTPEPAEVAA